MVLRSRGSSAEGYPVENGFLVKVGSRLSPDVSSTLSPYKHAIRLYLIAEHIVDEDYVFTRDYTFPSAAWAASVIAGMKGKADMWREE